MTERPGLSSTLQNAMERGETIVTGNERAARNLRWQFDNYNQAQGRLCWQPENVFSWEAWTAALWRELLLTGQTTEILLNRSQEHDLWLSVLRQDNGLDTLRSLDSLANLAHDALQLACAFQAEELFRRAPGSSDSRAFRRWVGDFDRVCRSLNFFPQSRLEQKLSEAIKSGDLSISHTVHLVGFLSLTPSQELLIGAAPIAGTFHIHAPVETPSASPLLVAAEDHADEILSAARWARSLLERNPGAQIAIVHPSLKDQRWLIEHSFHRIFPSSPGSAAPLFEFSLGTPLSEAKMIAYAIDLLQWATEPLSSEQISSLLLAPHFANHSGEHSQRAQFEAGPFRRAPRLRPQWTLAEFEKVLNSSVQKYPLPGLKVVLRAMVRLISTLDPSVQQSYEAWVRFIRDYLRVAGWGNLQGATSLEYQLVRKWETALDELCTLDFRGVLTTYPEALATLTHIAGQTIFAPKSRQAPIQILGTLESAGCTFDALWFLGATDLAWPGTIGTNPLLPRALQQALKMPGADKQNDLEFAGAATMSLIRSSSQAIFSYARRGPEGAQRASSLLAGLTSKEIPIGGLLPPQITVPAVSLETIVDAERIPSPSDPVVHGGARVLELQAACSFRAFAEVRLGSVELSETSLGMDAGERGTLVHKALELFWAHTRTQLALRAMSFAERESLVQQCIESALEEPKREASAAWDTAYLETQRDRLAALLRKWLDFELDRAPFEIVEHEKTVLATCGPLLLKTRIDRVDQTGDRTVLIDYKTGIANQAGWYGPRPDAPQLPLYAVNWPLKNIGGLLYAHLRPGESKAFSGIGDSNVALPKSVKQVSPAEFQEQLETWRSVLAALAEDFYNSEVVTDPKLYPKTCECCCQRILCRLNPLTMEDQEDEFACEESDG